MASVAGLWVKQGWRNICPVLLGIGPGETTPDRRFTWLPVSCLGVCEQAPAIMIDDDLYTASNRRTWMAFLNAMPMES